MSPGRPRGHPKTGGTKKGSQRKLTLSVKAAVMEAYEKAGGVKYLAQVAKEHPAVFCGLIGKVIPQEVRAEVESSYRVDIDIGQAMFEAQRRVNAKSVDAEEIHDVFSIEARPYDHCRGTGVAQHPEERLEKADNAI